MPIDIQTVNDSLLRNLQKIDDSLVEFSKVKTLFSGAVPPENPQTGQIWYDENTGILKRYDGTNWVDVVAIPDLSNVNDLTILNKLKNVDGAGSGLDADLVRGLPADFTSSLATSGYQKLPSGLIIQWMYYEQTSVLAHDSTYTFNFPIAFPNKVLSISAICFPGTNSSGVTYDYGVTIDKDSLTTSSVVLKVWDRSGNTPSTGPGKIWVYAIGY